MNDDEVTGVADSMPDDVSLSDSGNGMGETNSTSNLGIVDETDITNYFVNAAEMEDLFAKDIAVWTSEDLVGRCFITISAVEEFYRYYSKRVGFGIRRNNQVRDSVTGLVTMRRWVCSREGVRMNRDMGTEIQKREPRPVTRCCCRAVLIVRRSEPDGVYSVTKFTTDHNHEVASRDVVHFFRSNRHITTGHGMEIRTMRESGIKTCQIMDFMVTTLGGYSSVGFTAKDLYNFISSDNERKRSISTDAEATLAYFNALVETDPGLYVKYSVNEENRLSKIYWTDSRSRLDYANFGDVLVIDSTYKTNSFKMPLVEFVGINNHRSTVVFGSALVTDESIESYVWTFSSFLNSMGDKHPISVITDGDRAIAAALAKVMPNSRHRLCSWHLMRNARAVSNEASFLSDIRRCMLGRMSEDAFEESWTVFRSLHPNVSSQWLDEMYERKDKWADAFFKGIFFGGMTTNQRCESTNAYMNRFLNCDLSLYTFVRQYSRAMCRLRENVLRHDFMNHQSEMILQTHLHSLERSAANFYTRGVFLKVRDEMKMESSFTPVTISFVGGEQRFVLKKFGEDGQVRTIVSVNSINNSLSCDCGMFESVWWPCRHMFCAMKAVNMVEIPKSLLCNRWAKSSTSFGSAKGTLCVASSNELRYGSLISRAHQLCQLASTSDETYNRVMSIMETAIANVPQDQRDSGLGSSMPGKRKDPPVQGGNIVRDPEVVRTKGSQPDKMQGRCKETGHYKSSCPILENDEVRNKIEDLTQLNDSSRSEAFDEEDYFL